MEIQVRKWGNSLGIRIPQAIANQINIQDGSKINLVLKSNKIELSPAAPEEYKLNDLIELITEASLHNEITTGEPRGREIW
ncbi:MAG: AbrB/MazE/SpoVT family DNA-binding domain-containing protein [Ignavibacteria bacterium]|jgi:antitoxin MazE|nr:AbrB/MazE/SpoVT family DNA-binding domain-containing protein [Ignavibacteria bacterium]